MDPATGNFDLPGSFAHEIPEPTEQRPESRSETEPEPDAPPGGAAPKPRRQYRPRTCRICLEAVQPSFEAAEGGVAPSIFNPNPRVEYISEDPESGRLIRPCKCRGSQKYVHEGCLQAWRHSDASYKRQNYWECPTCKFRYHLERLRYSRLISHTATEILLTITIFLVTTFIFGFIADPIIDFYFDPWSIVSSSPPKQKVMYTVTHIDGRPTGHSPVELYPDPEATWFEHFLKGTASLGLLGFLKVLFAVPWYNIRQAGLLGGVGRGRAIGRNRLENISWLVVAGGIITFLYAIWKWVRAWSKSTLKRAGERVADVQGDDEDDDDE